MKHSLLVLTIAVTATLAGCRVYGGRGTEDATYAQMQRTVTVFQEELERARAELGALQQANVTDAYGQAVVRQYEAIVKNHEALVETQTELVESLSEESGYRDLSRAFGAMNVQQIAIRSQYQRLLQGVHTALADSSLGLAEDRPFHLVPPFYNRITAKTRDVSTNEVLSLLRGESAPKAPADTLGSEM